MKTILPALASLVLASCSPNTPSTPAPENVTKTGQAKPTSRPNSQPKAEARKPLVKTPPKLTEKPKPTVKPYPLETCLVTDEPLDEWDDMQTTIYNNQEMKFCCKMCLKKFNANPDKYIAMLP
ncbi:MAG: hypothetical protein ACON5H_06590 [Akkermansiaceae bacterium]